MLSLSIYIPSAIHACQSVGFFTVKKCINNEPSQVTHLPALVFGSSMIPLAKYFCPRELCMGQKRAAAF